MILLFIKGLKAVLKPLISGTLQRIKGLQGPTIIVISFLYLKCRIPPTTLLSEIVY